MSYRIKEQNKRRIILDIPCGYNIHRAIEGAKALCESEELEYVEFPFNKVIMRVGVEGTPDEFVRDYHRALSNHIDQVVGPELTTPTPETLEAESRKDEEKRARYREQARIERENSVRKLDAKLEGTPAFCPKDEAEWAQVREKNAGFEGILDYAESWGRLMQKRIEEVGYITFDEARRLSFVADGPYNMSGFTHGIAKSLLRDYWIHGEEFAKIDQGI